MGRATESRGVSVDERLLRRDAVDHEEVLIEVRGVGHRASWKKGQRTWNDSRGEGRGQEGRGGKGKGEEG